MSRYKFGQIVTPEELDYKIPDFGGLWTPVLVVVDEETGMTVASNRAVTPELAEKIMEYRSANQRNFSPSTERYYARVMRQKMWKMSPHGGIFNRKGRLIDSQSRLRACIASKTAVPMLFFFGFGGRAEQVILDSGRKRSGPDAIKAATGEAVSQLYTGSMVQMYQYTKNSAPSADAVHGMELAELEHRFRGLADKVAGFFKGTRSRWLDRTPVRAALLLALHVGLISEDQARRWVLVYTETTGADGPEDNGPFLLRRYINGFRDKKQSLPTGFQESNALFLRTLRAIQASVEKQELESLRALSRNPYIGTGIFDGMFDGTFVITEEGANE